METALVCEVPIGRVEEELVSLAGQLSAGLCRWLLLLGEFDRREGWAGFGISSCVHWLSIRLAISPSTARAQLAVAHALAGLPTITEHFAAGRLSYSQVRALCRVADAKNEAELVELARNMNAGQLERMCRLLRSVDDDTDVEAAASTSLTARWADDGTATIRVRLPTEDATVLMAAVEERLRKMDLPDTLPWEVRRAHALIEVVAEGAAATAPGRERPLVHITVPLADLEAGQGGTIDGRPIADANVRRMLCDGAVVGVVVDASGRPVAVGNKTRVPSAKVQRAVDVRDGKRCTYPACGRPAEETHHVLHWVDGHRTEVDLLTSQCGYHHRAHHRGRFNIGIDPATGHVRFTRPDGGPILTRVATSGNHADIPARFSTEPATVPAHWDGSPLLAAELTPPPRERTAPTTVHFGTHLRPETVARRLARTLSCELQQERDVWVTSAPDLITITPEPAGGSLITIELTTRPHHLTTALTTIGFTPVTGPPPRRD
ncbi:MAG: DUF222 domain-containing protein [Acidimicrobiales bacterium]